MRLPIMMLFGPPSRSGVRKLPSARMNTSSEPETMPGSESGTMTEKKVRIWLAPRSRLASR